MKSFTDALYFKAGATGRSEFRNVRNKTQTYYYAEIQNMNSSDKVVV
jgi:hypothetical protein